MSKVSDMTRKFWFDTLLGWAEYRLAPPQYDECTRALNEVRAERDAFAAALNRIAYEPIGPSDATHQQVLDDVTDIARRAVSPTAQANS
jgi:hypothetical protein